MKRRNEDLREQAVRLRIRLWEVAEALGMSDTKLSVMLRYELTRRQRDKVLKAIEEIARRRDAESTE
jgi:hypothetical protein